MNSDDGTTCFFCKKQLVSCSIEKWRVGKEEIEIPVYSSVWCLVESQFGEIAICLDCYIEEKHLLFDNPLAAEVECEFAMEFNQIGKLDDALISVKRAIFLSDEDRFRDLLDDIEKRR